jgi:hypothetical protein
MVEERVCKSQAPTLTGGRSSDMKENTSSTGRTTRYLMLITQRILKDKQFGYGRNTVKPTRDGQYSILTSNQRFQRKDSTRNSASTSTDHSISDQDFQ